MSQGKDFVIGMDLGGTFLKYALGTPEGELIVHKKTPSKGKEAKQEIFNVMFTAIEELLQIAKQEGGRVIAIGLGSPGAIDFDKGKQIGSTPNLPHWTDADMRGEIEARFGIPVWADNDANVMAFAETRMGAAKGCKYVIALTLGTGIGGGIILNKDIFRGANFAGAELGHLTIDYKGLKCNCGGTGCIERYASATGMVENYAKRKKIDPATVKTEDIFEQAKAGDADALATIDDTCNYLGAALATLVNIFNPEMIVIGGGVADAGDHFIKTINEVLKQKAMAPALLNLKLARARLGNKAGIIGAICLAAEMHSRTKAAQGV